MTEQIFCMKKTWVWHNFFFFFNLDYRKFEEHCSGKATPHTFFHVTKEMFFRVTKYTLYFLRWSGLLQSAAKKHLTVFKVCESCQYK